MADSKVTDLTAVVTPAGGDIFYTSQGGVDKQITATQIVSLASAGVDTSGTPADNQLAIFTDADTLEGDANLIWDGADLTLGTGQIFGAASTNAAPFYSFSEDPDSGLYWQSAGTLSIVLNGSSSERWKITGQTFGGAISGSGRLFNAVASATVPTLIPNNSDTDTGIGWTAANKLALIAGAVEGFTVQQDNSGCIVAFDETISITANANSSQGDTPLTTSVNIIATCATAGDAVTLPDQFAGGAIVIVINRGAESCDVFPASGDTILPSAVNVAKAVPAGESQIFIARAANTSWTAVIPSGGLSASDLTTIAAGSAAAPSLAWGDSDSGIFESADDTLKVSIAGAAQWQFTGASFRGENVVGPSMQNEAASATNPVFCPNILDLDTGLGASDNDELSLIAGAVEGIRLVETNGTDMLISYKADVTQTASVTQTQGNGLLGGSYNEISVVANDGDTVTLPAGHEVGTAVYIKNNGANSLQIFPNTGDTIQGLAANTAFNLPSGGSVMLMTLFANVTWTRFFDHGESVILAPDGSSSAPAYSFAASGQQDIGFYRSTTDEVSLALGGVAQAHWVFSTSGIAGVGTDRPAILDASASATVPTLTPRNDDSNTGIGRNDPDELSLISGGVEALRLAEASSHILFAHQSNVGLTADVGSAQGNGVILSSINQYSTVGTAGDAATLPAAFPVGTEVHVINDGANSMDVFPASGDDAGAGANTAVAVAAGARAKFLATAASATWATIYNA
jgi:hypothetical protein